MSHSSRPPLPDTSPDWLARGWGHAWSPYTPLATTPPPLPVVRTKGVIIELANGRKLIDGTGGAGAAIHGYNHPHIDSAIKAQLHHMPHALTDGLAYQTGFDLSARLAEVLPGDLNHVFLSDGGVAAVEAAMTMALRYYLVRGESGRDTCVRIVDGDQGDSSVSGTDLAWQPLPKDSESLKELSRFFAQQGRSVAAIIVEPLLQAESMNFHAPEALRHLRRLADQHGCLLIFDETFTGFGRTGEMFAADLAGVMPDIMTLSGALTGGFMTLGATAALSHVFEAFLSGSDDLVPSGGSSSLASPLACAAANASLDLFGREDRRGQVRAIEAIFDAMLEPLRDLPGVADVRARGAVGVIQLQGRPDSHWLREQFVAAGVWLQPRGNIIPCTPAYTIGEDELTLLIEAMAGVIADWSKEVFSR